MLRETLPSSVVSQLVERPPVFRGLVAVDATKEATISELDAMLLGHSPPRYLKNREVEISRKELSLFRYYRISPRRLDVGKEIDGRLSAPRCNKCFRGRDWETPLTLAKRVLGKFDLGEIMRPHSFTVELIVSRELREVFSEVGITGLRYDSMDGTEHDLARIKPVYRKEGDMILSDVRCKKHRTVTSAFLLRPQTPVEDFQEDFVMQRGARVSGIEYEETTPGWCVSRRVLEIMLEHTRGLEAVTTRNDENFKPCLSDS